MVGDAPRHISCSVWRQLLLPARLVLIRFALAPFALASLEKIPRSRGTLCAWTDAAHVALKPCVIP